jgi:hypothetical protein
MIIKYFKYKFDININPEKAHFEAILGHKMQC